MSLTKSIFRQKCIKKMKSASRSTKYYRDAMVNERLIKEIERVKPNSILFYYPLEFEADIRKTLLRVRKVCDVYLPFMQDKSFKIVPFRLPLKRKKFGIYEAGDTLKNINKIDMAIVPAVGVDGRLQRVGFGKGMYDRFFEKLKKKPYTIFVQPDICFTKEFICDEYDIACDLLITPKMIKRRSTRPSSKRK